MPQGLVIVVVIGVDGILNKMVSILFHLRKDVSYFLLYLLIGPSVTHKPPPLQRAPAGVVFTLPQCLDQTIHADTPHLYEHVQLPCHYLNLFIPAANEGILKMHELGQTAFVCKSHIMKNSAVMMQSGLSGSKGSVAFVQDGDIWLEDELIRPHLSLGDCLLFDCRILHFGLGNYTHQALLNEDTRLGGHLRPMLYINHHYNWFVDKKNWNNQHVLYDINKTVYNT